MRLVLNRSFFIASFLLIPLTGFSKDWQTYLLAGSDFDLGEAPNLNSVEKYENDYSSNFGLGLNYRFTKFRWSNRIERFNGSTQYINISTNEKIHYSMNSTSFSTGLDYFFDLNNPSIYLTLRFGGENFKLKSEKSGHSKNQQFLNAAAGAGLEYRFLSNLYLFTELLLQKNNFSSMTLDNKKINGKDIRGYYFTHINIGIGVEF
jgi:opacity protein-like surface antigen